MALHPDWIFDDSEISDPRGYGERAVDFLKRLRHPKSEMSDKQLVLPRYWERIIRRIYGPVDKDGRRIVKRCFIMIPRGGRKTTIAAGLGLLHTVGYESMTGSEAIAAASSEDQASIAFNEAVAMCEETPWLQDRAKVKLTESKFTIERIKNGASFRAISSDGRAQLGKSQSFVIADELIAWKGRDLWKALNTGLPKVPGSLLLMITQAGRGQTNLGFEIYEYAKRVATGAIDDPGFLPIIFEPPQGADWQDESLWHRVNPGLREGFPDIGGLRQAAREAKYRPADRDDFKQFNLNFWLEKTDSPFVDMEKYDEGDLPVDVDLLKDQPCYVAVDLGLVNDLAAVVAVWKSGSEGHEEYDTKAWFFCPEDSISDRQEKDKVPYVRWSESGYIIPTPGTVTDYGAITEFLRCLAIPGHELDESFRSVFRNVEIPLLNVQEMVFDPAYARSITLSLMNDNLPVASMRQGWITMSPAIKELERAIMAKRLRHDGHPILRWCFENVVVRKDSNNNKVFHKGNSRDRIDGAMALAMAVGRAHIGETPVTSFWETEDVSSLFQTDTEIRNEISKIFGDG